MKLTRNFRLEELACHDGTPVPEKYRANALAICQRAQLLRDEIVEPLIVISGYRTAAYNRRVGGAKGSQHLTAGALDLCARSFSALALRRVVEAMIRDGHIPDGGLGVYPSWIHIDIGRPRRWRGPNEKK